MFKRKNKVESTAASVIPPQSIIHNYNQTPWPAIIAVAFLCIVTILPILWWMLVFLFDKIGYPDPEAAVAFWLVIIPLVSIGFLWIRWLTDGILTRILDYKRDAIAMALELERTKLLTAQSDVDGMRMNSEDRPFAKLIVAVMYEAITHGPKGQNGEIRWSRRQAKALSDTHGLGLSEGKCGALAPWLRQYGVITKDNKIASRYNSLSRIKELVSDVFNIPVTIVDGIGMNDQHLHREDGNNWA